MRIKKFTVTLAGLLTACVCSTMICTADENKYNSITSEHGAVEEYETELSPLDSVERYSSPYSDIVYSYTDKVSSGKIRYISQKTSSKYFQSKYWGKWTSSFTTSSGLWYGGPGQECNTCCISMSLSYIGVNKTPEDILNFGSGATISNTGWGGSTYKSSSFETAFKRYIEGNGSYSPPIIHLNNYSYAGHYVVVIGKKSDNVYEVLDPNRDSIWTLTMNGNKASYTAENGASKTDTVTSAYQYYKKDSQIIKPFLSNVEAPLKDTTYTTDVNISGWAIYGKGITKVTGTVNGNTIELSQKSRSDVAKAYPGYPTGKEGFSGTISAKYLKNGNNTLELKAYYNSEVFSIGKINVKYENKVKPTISNVNVVEDVDGYTITCEVSDDCGIDRVQFPTWTALNGKDDFDNDWSKSEFSKGELKDGKVTYRVNRADHNGETGKYTTHIYAYDIHGNHSTYAVEVEFDSLSPDIKQISSTLAEDSFNVYCTVSDESGVNYVEYRTYKMTDGKFELYNEGYMESSIIWDATNESTFTCTNSVSKEEPCYYKTDIYAYDIYGNCAIKSHVVYMDNDKTKISPIATKIYEGNTYMLFDMGEMTMDEAVALCRSYGGAIAQENSEEEAVFLQSLTSEYGLPSFVCEISATGICGDELEYSISEDSVLTITGHGAIYNWIEGMTAPWHYYKNKITKVVIEEGVTIIGASTFEGLVNLTEVVLPSSLKEIETNGFKGAFSLAEISIPRNVEKIWENAFADCFSLKRINIYGKNTEIAENELNQDVVITGYMATPAEVFSVAGAYTFVSLSGDVDLDGNPKATDALMILKHAASMEILAEEHLLDAADCNNDNKVDASDALVVLKMAAGIL